MSDRHSKIITSFQNRLALENAIRSFADTSDDQELYEKAQGIAEQHGEQAIPAMLAALNTSNPQLRGGLGYLSTFFDQDRTITALSAVARDRSEPDQARMSAIMILQRYLGVEPDESMYANMASPEKLALQSLQQVLAEVPANPSILLDYLGQLSFEPLDVLMTMVQSTRRLSEGERVELLRLFAQDPHTPAASEALGILGSTINREASKALQELIPTLPPDRKPEARRALQKLRLQGIAVTPPAPPPAASRCLASPIDIMGRQLLWFCVPNEDEETCAVLQLQITGQAGIVDALGNLSVPNETLPPAMSKGTLHAADKSLPGLTWLEAPFDYGRRRVLDGLSTNWLHRTTPSLAYRFHNVALWRWSPPQPRPTSAEPQPVAPEETLILLDQVAMAGWVLLSERVFEAAEAMLETGKEITPEQFERGVEQLTRTEFADQSAQQALVKTSLNKMSEWLALAGEQTTADLAAATAWSLDRSPEGHPFLLAVTARGLRSILIALAQPHRS
ncbi:MAG: hypothetical protein U9R25_17900 [Chloroflexota bacterium]|nr:hypothetical protein [Chloroflexota bacterium]